MSNPSDAFKLRKSFFHSLGKANTEATQEVYESKYKSLGNISNYDVWTSSIPFCSGQAQADAFISGNPSVAKKHTLVSLYPVSGSNNQAYYIDISGKWERPWISPVDAPNQITNSPSNGFQAKLYTSTSLAIPPTLGTWVVDYYAGMVYFQENYTPLDLGWGVPKISCYQYVGNTLTGFSGEGFSVDNLYDKLSGINHLIFKSGDRVVISGHDAYEISWYYHDPADPSIILIRTVGDALDELFGVSDFSIVDLAPAYYVHDGRRIFYVCEEIGEATAVEYQDGEVVLDWNYNTSYVSLSQQKISGFRNTVGNNAVRSISNSLRDSTHNLYGWGLISPDGTLERINVVNNPIFWVSGMRSDGATATKTFQYQFYWPLFYGVSSQTPPTQATPDNDIWTFVQNNFSSGFFSGHLTGLNFNTNFDCDVSGGAYFYFAYPYQYNVNNLTKLDSRIDKEIFNMKLVKDNIYKQFNLTNGASIYSYYSLYRGQYRQHYNNIRYSVF